MNPLEEHLINQRRINSGKHALSTISGFVLGIIVGIIVYNWYIRRDEEDE